MPASVMRSRVAREFWERAFKFTIGRHPCEKAVSLAYLQFVQCPARRRPPFAEFLQSAVGAWRLSERRALQ